MTVHDCAAYPPDAPAEREPRRPAARWERACPGGVTVPIELAWHGGWDPVPQSTALGRRAPDCAPTHRAKWWAIGTLGQLARWVPPTGTGQVSDFERWFCPAVQPA